MLPEKEKHLFFNALTFYTRLPAPANTPYSPELLNQSRKYFTCIGILVGLIATFSYGLGQLFFPNEISLLLSMVATILATGAFHEDGFADTCDALGGGWQKPQILAIMKDSRLGTYGTLGLVFILSLKYLSLLQLTHSGLLLIGLVFISGHTLSRQLAGNIIDHYLYVQDSEQSKVKPVTQKKLSTNARQFSYLISAAPLCILLFIQPLATFFAVLASYAVSHYFMAYCKKRIGGYTGDILGANQQLAEVVFYLCFLALL